MKTCPVCGWEITTFGRPVSDGAWQARQEITYPAIILHRKCGAAIVVNETEVREATESDLDDVHEGSREAVRAALRGALAFPAVDSEPEPIEVQP